MVYNSILLLASAILFVSCNSGTRGTQADVSENTTSNEVDYETSSLAGCTNLNDSHTIHIYRAVKNANAYLSPSINAETIEFSMVETGNCLIPSVTVEITSYDDTWYLYSWRGEEYYYLQSDFEVLTYEGTANFFCSFLQDHAPLFFANDEGGVVTFFLLDQNDCHLEVADDLNIQDHNNVYMMSYNNQDPVALEDEDGVVKLVSVYMQPSTGEPGDFSDLGSPVSNYRLIQDAHLAVFYDPDFCTDAYFIPSEMSVLIGGTLYRYIDLADAPVDKQALGLKGNVHTMSEHVQGDLWLTYYFDRQGNLASVRSNTGADYCVSRSCSKDAGNDLVLSLCVESDEAVTRDYYVVNLQQNRLSSQHGSDGGESYTFDYRYDDRGELKTIDVQYASPDDDNLPLVKMAVEVCDTDAQGNWLVRRVGDAVKTRKIEYYN